MSDAGRAGRLRWYADRLRVMGPAEVAWRLRRAAGDAVAGPLEARAQRALPDDDAWWQAALGGFRRAEARPLLLDRERARRIAGAAPGPTEEVVVAAEAVVAGRVRYFGYPEARLSSPVDWHHDPLADHHWPRVPSRRIDHRTAPADPKWIWELNRLQHLPLLAEAWLLTGREEFAATAFDHLSSWLDAHPVGVGIAWRGAFEAGIRSISVLVALQGLRDHRRLDVALFRRLVTVLDAGARVCWRERSLHSSANNHLVGELTGLACVALMLPELPRADRWRRRALAGLGAAAADQVLPDGASAEQSVGYQLFTGDLLLVTATLLRSAGAPVPPALTDALRRSAVHLAALVADGEPAPRTGDDDEGVALRLGPPTRPTVGGHLALLAAYGAAEPASDAGLAARWVQAATAAGEPVALTATPRGGSLHAPDGGLVVLRSAARGHRQRVTVDVGPLGYLAIAAHGHADALAVTWTLDGREVVVDPGTAGYYGHPEWRTVHRSTSAHATVAVDGEDSSQMAGPFLWTSHARVAVAEVDLDAGVVEAEHDGYTRLPDPVRHRRRVVAAPDGLGLVVLDLLDAPGEAEHEAVVSWPLAAGLGGVATTDGFAVTRDGRAVADLHVAASVATRPQVLVADERSHLGWDSYRLESREAACLVRSRLTWRGTAAVVTVLRPAGSDPVSGPRVELAAGGAVASWLQGSDRCVQEIPKARRSGAPRG